MPDPADREERISQLANTSRNRRQASVLLNEIARGLSNTATRQRAQSEKLVHDCVETYEKSKKLCKRKAG